VNLARTMLVLGLRSEGRRTSRGLRRLLRLLDRDGPRAFESDVPSLVAPWMYWLGIPLVLAGVLVTAALRALGLPAPVVAAIAWICASDASMSGAP
jgi:hypothetical protein